MADPLKRSIEPAEPPAPAPGASPRAPARRPAAAQPISPGLIRSSGSRSRRSTARCWCWPAPAPARPACSPCVSPISWRPAAPCPANPRRHLHNKAAREMKARVGDIVGHVVEGMPWLGTFHSIGEKIYAAMPNGRTEKRLHHSTSTTRSGCSSGNSPPRTSTTSAGRRAHWPRSSTAEESRADARAGADRRGCGVRQRQGAEAAQGLSGTPEGGSTPPISAISCSE